MAFDKHLNLVLSDCEEQRTITSKGDKKGATIEKTQRRHLGLIILRGENVVSITVEGGGGASKVARRVNNGPGTVTGVGRGAPVQQQQQQQIGGPPPGLGMAPLYGIGGGVGQQGMGRGMGRGSM